MTYHSYATLSWDEQGQPCSTKFADIYFSKASGLEETKYIFLQHNHLTERFQKLNEQQCFTIGETGFGTGLNFLCTWQLFTQHAPQNSFLHFISVEKYPLTVKDLQQSLQLWPELTPLAQQLSNQYYISHEGIQTFSFEQGKITLTLLIGDALQQLSSLNTQIDAWFLDGFAPAKNPQMWSSELFQQLARLSKPMTTLATFTSAGMVRRGLIEVGFKINKTKGFAAKREMIYGYYQVK